MSALTDLQAAVTALTTGTNSLAAAIAIALPEINPAPATGGATDAQLVPITVTVNGIVQQLTGIVGQLNAATAPPVAPAIPAAPTGVLATAQGSGIIAFSFPAVPGASSYNLKRGLTSGTESTVATIADPATGPVTATDATGLAPGTVLFYEVSAVNSAGESPNSVEVQVTA